MICCYNSILFAVLFTGFIIVGGVLILPISQTSEILNMCDMALIFEHDVAI